MYITMSFKKSTGEEIKEAKMSKAAEGIIPHYM